MMAYYEALLNQEASTNYKALTNCEESVNHDNCCRTRKCWRSTNCQRTLRSVASSSRVIRLQQMVAVVAVVDGRIFTSTRWRTVTILKLPL